MYCPECKQEFEGKFCPECGSRLIEKPVAQQASGFSVNLGDANAISGGLNLKDSHDSHHTDNSVHNTTTNTSTVNNITQVSAQKTEAELFHDRKAQFMTVVDQVLEDGVIDKTELALLERERIRLGLDKHLTDQIIEQAKRNARPVVSSLMPTQQLIIKQIKKFIQENNNLQIERNYPRIEVLAKNTGDEESHFLYCMIKAVKKPQDLIKDIEGISADNYWKSYWSYLAYINAGKFAEAENVIFNLANFTSYQPENITLLYALGSLREFGIEETKQILSTLTGAYHEFLVPFASALTFHADPEFAEMMGFSKDNLDFYIKEVLKIAPSKQEVAEPESATVRQPEPQPLEVVVEKPIAQQRIEETPSIEPSVNTQAAQIMESENISQKPQMSTVSVSQTGNGGYNLVMTVKPSGLRSGFAKVIQEKLGIDYSSATSKLEKFPAVILRNQPKENIVNLYYALTDQGAKMEVVEADHSDLIIKTYSPGTEGKKFNLVASKIYGLKSGICKAIQAYFNTDYSTALSKIERMPSVILRNKSLDELIQPFYILNDNAVDVEIIENLNDRSDINIKNGNPDDPDARFDLVMTAVHGMKSAGTKILRNDLGMSISQAMNKMDNLPTTVMRDKSFDELVDMYYKLTDHGMDMQIEASGDLFAMAIKPKAKPEPAKVELTPQEAAPTLSVEPEPKTVSSPKSDSFVLELVNAGKNKLSVAKILKEELNISLGEAVNYVNKTPSVLAENESEGPLKAVYDKLQKVGAEVKIKGGGVQTQNNVTVSATSNTKDEEPRKPSSFRLVLESPGDKYLSCIKLLREHLGMDLKKANDTLRSCPSVLMTSKNKGDLEKLYNELQKLNARVKIVNE